MYCVFYDIESLANVFTICFFNPGKLQSGEKAESKVFDGRVTLYYLIDDPDLAFEQNDDAIRVKLHDRILDKNSNFRGEFKMYDLREKKSCDLLAKAIGVSDQGDNFSDPSFVDKMKNAFRPVCDTDPEYDENIHPYLMGYNSYNYDTTMLARFFELTYYVRGHFKGITASEMRRFNDKLFSPEFKENMPKALRIEGVRKRSCGENIRRNMMLSGRHIDVARLNEKQSKVALKRLLGMLGYQILESDKLSSGNNTIATFDELADLIAYNASDVINLCCLFLHRNYQAQFLLKKQLLETYPELIYLPKKDDEYVDTYEPGISCTNVRKDRLTIDSSSAQFATKCLCPYGHLTDMPVLSYMYPSERKAKELGIKRVNVLEETKKFFYSNFPQPELRAQFDRIYDFYKSLEGENFNSSKSYAQDYGRAFTARKTSDFPKINGCLPYFRADGTPSTCFVVFGIGGIHGAQFNWRLYEYDVKQYEKAAADMEYVKSKYPEAVELRRNKAVIMQDGETVRPYNDFLKTGATMKKAEYRELVRPSLFSCDAKGNWKLTDRYVYTSADDTNHEDFTSYYPNMLRMMSAFWNPGLGYDRYAEIFDNKQKYGKLMKDKSLTAEQREFYRVMREGTKLILNSASGAADTNFNSPIQMNNTILAMRIIGQLFSWRIGQAQTIAGAEIVSTNTDGLYSVLEAELNNKILERESASIGVEIEPEPLYLISKDSNNRMEMVDGNIISASGGTLGCRKGPDPAKALAHPAIIDWALSEYLIQNGAHLSETFDKEAGRKILDGALDAFNKQFDSPRDASVHALIMFQNVIASSPSTFKYKYGRQTGNDQIVLLPHYNRTFILKEDADFLGTIHLSEAAARKVDKKIVEKRKKDGHPLYSREDKDALYILKTNGVRDSEIKDRDVITQKVSNVEQSWHVAIVNRSLYAMSDAEVKRILDSLDIEAYLFLLENAYQNSWRNMLPPEHEEEAPKKETVPVILQESLF